jgi:pimeloyl-ACP methyl ester carboxylesterase
MTVTATTVTLPDGRSLDALVGGAERGLGLIAHHGTPADATRFASWDEPAARHGLRLVTYSRPGYATSTRHEGRAVGDVAADIAVLADATGVGEFVAIGRSGGGPHAIACAALLPDRCLAAAALVTVAPLGAPNLDWFDGMAQLNLDEFGAALRGEDALREWMAEHGEEYRHVRGEDLAAALGDALPPVDQAALAAGAADGFASSIRRGLEHGFDGWVDDDLAFTRPWGLELASIERPVRIWQGELDRLVPLAHGRWLADVIPGAHFVRAAGQGHLSLGDAHHDPIVDDLLAAAEAGAAR